MGSFSSFNGVSVVSNSTISNFQIIGTTMSFDVTGQPATGFCTVTIPHSILLQPYTIEIDGSPPSSNKTIYENSTESIIYFTYPQSTHEVTITSAPIHDVAITNATSFSKTVVFQGYNMTINVTAADPGSYTETFNVTVYANMTYIATYNASQNVISYLPVTYVNTTAISSTQTVTLNSTDTVTLTFAWNATGFAKGIYTISAYAWPVSGETNTANNNFTDGSIYVSMVGDLTGASLFVPDGKCDGRDITVVAKCFGSKLGDSNYNPNCDIFNRGKIDGRDITIVAKNFGEHDP
jgi:hypothetical protein